MTDIKEPSKLGKTQRQHLVARLIESQVIANQQALVDHLAAEGRVRRALLLVRVLRSRSGQGPRAGGRPVSGHAGLPAHSVRQGRVWRVRLDA